MKKSWILLFFVSTLLLSSISALAAQNLACGINPEFSGDVLVIELNDLGPTGAVQYYSNIAPMVRITEEDSTVNQWHSKKNDDKSTKIYAVIKSKSGAKFVLDVVHSKNAQGKEQWRGFFNASSPDSPVASGVQVSNCRFDF